MNRNARTGFAVVLLAVAAAAGLASRIGGGGASCPPGWSTGAPCTANTGPAGDGVSSLTTMTSAIWTANYGTWTVSTTNGVSFAVANVTSAHAGATIQGYDIQAQVVISANNVTLKNDKIHLPSPGVPTCGTPQTSQSGNIAQFQSCGSPFDAANQANNAMVGSRNFDGGTGITGITLSYDEIDCGGTTTQSGPKNLTYLTPYEEEEGIEYGHWTGDHLNIHGCGNGVLMRTDTHLTNSYVWGLAENSSCFLAAHGSGSTGQGNATCDHLDAIEATNGTANVGGATSSSATGDYLVGSWNRNIWLAAIDNTQSFTNFTFANNWLSENGSFYAVSTCTSASNQACGSTPDGQLTNIAIKNNRYVRYSFPFNTTSPVLNPNGLNTDTAVFFITNGPSVTNFTICGNVWDDSGAYINEPSNTQAPC